MDDRSMRGITIELPASAYSLSAIKKTMYRFTGRCHATILETEPVVRLELTPCGLESFDRLRGDFLNELLDQDLREIVARESEGIRNLLLAQAFSAASLTDPVSDKTTDDAHEIGALTGSSAREPDRP